MSGSSSVRIGQRPLPDDPHRRRSIDHASRSDLREWSEQPQAERRAEFELLVTIALATADRLPTRKPAPTGISP